MSTGLLTRVLRLHGTSQSRHTPINLPHPKQVLPRSLTTSNRLSNAHKTCSTTLRAQFSRSLLQLTRSYCTANATAGATKEKIIAVQIEDTWLNQEKNEELKAELEVIFGRAESAEDVEFEVLGRRDGDAPRTVKNDRFTTSVALGLTTMNPAHKEPSEKERLSMKVFLTALFYAQHEDRGDLALIALKQSLSLNPYLSEAWYKLGSYYMMHQSTEKAIEALEKCVQLSPLYVQAYSDLAAALMVTKNFGRALSLLQKAFEITPNNLPILYNKAICHQTRHEWKDAIAAYERILHVINTERTALEKDPMVIDTAAGVNERSVVLSLANCYSTAESMVPVLDNKPKGFYSEKSRIMLERFLDREPKDDKVFCMLGYAYSEVGNLNAAIESFQNAVNANPESVDAHANLGMLQYTSGKFAASLGHLEHALELDSSLHQLHIYAAHVHRNIGNVQEAINHYRKALEGNPAGAAEANVYLGVLLFNAGQIDESKAYLDEASKYFPQSIEVHYYLAKYHKNAQNIVPARSHFEMAYRLTIASMPAGLKQSFEYLEQGNHASFASSISNELRDTSVIRGDSLNMPASSLEHTSGSEAQYMSTNAASLLKEVGRLADAIRVYQAILAAAPSFIPAMMNLAETYEAAGLMDNAIEQYMMAVETDPKMAEAQVQLGSAFAARGDFEKALPYLQSAVQLNRNNMLAWHTLADCQVELGQYRSAQQSYNMVLRLNPNESDAHVGVGVAFHHLKRYKDAEMSYAQALEVSNYTNHLAYYNLSSTLFAQQRSAEALQALRKTVELEPDFAHAHLDIALSLLEGTEAASQGSGIGGSGRVQVPVEEVTEHLRKAISLDPSLIERVPKAYHKYAAA